MNTIAFIDGGWYIVDLKTKEKRMGPYGSRQEAYRIAGKLYYRLPEGVQP